MGTFEDEWAQLRQGAPSPVGDMRLASTEAPDQWSGDGGDGVKSDKAAWNAAGASVSGLRSNVTKALTELEHGQRGVESGTAKGVASAKAQGEVYLSWQRYLKAVGERCVALKSRLEKAGNDHYQNDQAMHGAFAGMNDQYRDTPAVGGQSQGR
ncbi:hypothetical protein [Streptomyces zagrosensis]|uniref:Uncharacterized protein YukE n=1 Tax=Streptomyces zagrosensis TaxID=1042984 RepID=A0A7W9UZ74_9ACTN|nr:hypothetical protein [Streptomyces zagrosensis]MBB5936735.1 uncharacterized protein YukE [Streptomyces zagrosensis]